MFSDMSLRCRLGMHAPAREPLWNCGFYFARCARCDQDIVRASGERWHVPRRAVVVWRKTPPPDYRWGELLSGEQASDTADPGQAQAAVVPVRYRWDEFNESHELSARTHVSRSRPPTPRTRPPAADQAVDLPPQPRNKTGRRSTIPDFMSANPPPMPTQADYVPIAETSENSASQTAPDDEAPGQEDRQSASISHLSGYR